MCFRCFVGQKPLEIKLLVPIVNVVRENALIMATELVSHLE